MNKKKRTPISSSLAIAALVIGIAFLGLHRVEAEGTLPHPSRTAAATAGLHPPALVTAHNAPPPVPGMLDGVTMTYDPFKPSDGPYPVLKPGEKIWIDVSIDQQLVYLFRGATRIYTMATSSGLESVAGDASPLGVYHIQAKRGRWFYVPQYHEGAEYWVSWLGNGIYLFHSVPMNRDRQIIPGIAAELLHEASHGCFHLTIADAKWFYEHVPYGATVVVERAPVLLKGDTIYHPSRAQRQAIAST